jgi:hypothetical protein
MALRQLNLLMFRSSEVIAQNLSPVTAKKECPWQRLLVGGLTHVKSRETIIDQFALPAARPIVMLSARQLIPTIRHYHRKQRKST